MNIIQTTMLKKYAIVILTLACDNGLYGTDTKINKFIERHYLSVKHLILSDILIWIAPIKWSHRVNKVKNISQSKYSILRFGSTCIHILTLLFINSLESVEFRASYFTIITYIHYTLISY